MLDGFEAIASPLAYVEGQSGVERRVLGALLTELDGTGESHDGVQLLAIVFEVHGAEDAWCR